jgi:TP901 family phage tail tape measure protein
MKIGQLYAGLGLDTTHFERGLTNAQNRMKVVGGKMKKIGKNLSMYVTAPLAGIGAAAFKSYMEFESSMSKIIGLVGVAREQVGQWEDQILSAGASMGKAPAEMADALFFVTSAGLRGADAMDALNSSARASAAGLGETKTVADLVTSAMNAYGSEVLGAEQATDVLVAAVREGKAEAPQLAESLGQVLPIASELGVSFDQVGASVAAMTRTGTDASTAAIQLRQILASMLKPSKQAETAMAEMGLSAQGLRKQIKEDGLVSVLQTLKDKQNEYGDDTLAKVFPNIRALSGVLDIMGGNAEENIAIFERMTDTTGSLDDAYGAASQTAKHRFNVAMAQGKTALVSIGKSLRSAFLPLLEGLGDMLRKVADWFAGLNSTQQRWVTIIAGAVAAIGPLMVIFGFMMSNVIPGLIAGFKGIITVFKALRAVIATNPLGVLLTAAAALAPIIVGLVRNSRLFNSEQKQMADLASKSAAQYNIQKNKAGELFSELKALTAQSDLTAVQEKRRKEIIKELNTQYADYLPNQLSEKSNLEDIGKAQNNVNEGLRENYILKAKQEKQEEIQNELMETQEKAYRKLNDALKDQGKTAEERQRLITKLLKGEVDELVGAGEQYQKYNELYAQYGRKVAVWYRKNQEAAKEAATSQKLLNDEFAVYIDMAKQDIDPTVGMSTSAFGEQASRIKQQVDDAEEAQKKIKKAESGGGSSALAELQNELKARTDVIREEYQERVGVIQQAAKNGKITWDEEQQLMMKLTNKYTREYRDAWKSMSEQVRREALGFSFTPTMQGPTDDGLGAAIQQANKQEISVGLPDFKPMQQGLADMRRAVSGVNIELQEMSTTGAKGMERLKEIAEQFSGVISGAVSSMASQLGAALVEGEEGFKSMVGTALDAIGQIINGLLAQAIAGVIAGESSKGLIGLALAAAGVGVLKAMWSKNVESQKPQGLATGGEVVRSGIFKVGEKGEEIVNLPRGAAVTPNHMINQSPAGMGGGNVNVTGQFRLDGTDLIATIERTEAKNKRKG